MCLGASRQSNQITNRGITEFVRRAAPILIHLKRLETDWRFENLSKDSPRLLEAIFLDQFDRGFRRTIQKYFCDLNGLEWTARKGGWRVDHQKILNIRIIVWRKCGSFNRFHAERRTALILYQISKHFTSDIREADQCFVFRVGLE